MKIITDLLLTSLLIGSATIVGYTSYYENTAKTSINAPNSIQTNGKVLTSHTELKNNLGATSSVRKAQANADIRAREQRYRFFGQGKPRSDRDLQSEVRSKLEMNLPNASLAVNSNRGTVTVAGMVGEEFQLSRIEALAKEINGVKRVEVRASSTPQ